MNQAQKLAAGLSLLGESVKGASFYNSSGGNAAFELTRALTEVEQNMVEALGFGYEEVEGLTQRSGTLYEVTFSEWDEE